MGPAKGVGPWDKSHTSYLVCANYLETCEIV